jgi:hypothetical protein
MNRIPLTQQLRGRHDQQDFLKLKGFYIAKETFTRLKRQPTKGEKIFASYTSDKRIISRGRGWERGIGWRNDPNSVCT